MNNLNQTPNERDFLFFLQEEFLKRCRKNPKYSLRAFAKSLKLSHATLSHVLRGRRPLTPRMQNDLAERLHLSPEERGIFRTTKKAVSNAENFHQISIDQFNVISDWYHDAIIELTKTKHFKSDARWIAKKLGIGPSETQIAIDRLLRLRLLEADADGHWKATHPSYKTPSVSSQTQSALIRFQKQAFEKATDALDLVSPDKRGHSTLTVAVALEDIEEIKKRIRKFRKSMNTFLSRSGVGPDAVYQMSIALFPITQLPNGENHEND